MNLGWSATSQTESLDGLRARLLDNVLLLIACAASPGIALSISRAASIGWQPFMVVHLVILLGLWGLFVFRARIAYRPRVYALLGLMLLGAFSGYVHLGPAAEGKLLLVSIAMLAALFLSVRAAVSMVAICTLGVLSLGAATLTGHLIFALDYRDYAHNPLTWLHSAWNVGLYAGIVAYVSAVLLRRISESEQHFRSLFAAMSEAVILQTADGRLIDANRAARAMLSTQDGECIGCREDGSAWDIADLPGRLSALSGSQNVSGVIRVCNADGGLRFLHVACNPFARNLDGEVCSTVAVLSDVTEQQVAAERLEHARDLAETANRAKSEFLANMSHEIRTPMNAVIGMVHLLLQTPLNAQQRNYVEKTQQAARSLLGVLNDILDFSKIEAGMMALEQVDFELEALLQNITGLLAHQVDAKGLELLMDVEPEVPRWLRGDPLRLAQILANLLSNAVKFTEQGEVRLRISLLRSDERTARIAVVCSDTGIGMSTQQQEHLFQAFFQADSSITRRFGGTGLGLAICWQLLALMDSKLELQSAPGEGSTFRFELDLPLAEPRADLPAVSVMPGQRALLVDDNEPSRCQLGEMLARAGFEVSVAETGEQAIEQVDQAEPGAEYDLILIDARMPGMDGMELARSLRGHKRLGAASKFVLCSSQVLDPDAFDASFHDHAVDAVLTKPVTDSGLQELLRRLSGAVSCDPPPEWVMPNLSGMRVLLVDDVDLNRELGSELLRRAGAEVQLAADGVEALSAVFTELDAGSRFDLVLMDVQMPGMDGLEATRRLRERIGAEQLPIVAMTAHAMLEQRQNCLLAGMQDQIDKPIDPAVFYAAVARFCPSAVQPESVASAPGTAPMQAEDAAGKFNLPQVAGLDFALGLHRVAGQRSLYESMLGRFAERYGDAAEQIAMYLTSGQRAEAERLAHSVRGMAGTLGAVDLQQAAGTLETALGNALEAENELASFRQQLQRLSAALAEFLRRKG